MNTPLVLSTGIYAYAGADVLFVSGVVDVPTIAELVHASPLPLDVMVGPAAPSVRQLAEVGVAWISVGLAITIAASALATAAANELLTDGTCAALSTR